MVTDNKEKQQLTGLGKQVKKRLIDRGMTQKDLADQLGTTPQYLNKILHGERSGKKYQESIRALLGMDREEPNH